MPKIEATPVVMRAVKVVSDNARETMNEMITLASWIGPGDTWDETESRDPLAMALSILDKVDAKLALAMSVAQDLRKLLTEKTDGS